MTRKWVLPALVAIAALGAGTARGQTALGVGLGNYWPFDEGQGTIAHDVISHQNGTLTNFQFDSSDGWRPGWTGKAGDHSIQFDGVDDYINLGNYSLPTTSSISAWVNIHGFTGTPENLAFYILGSESEGNLASPVSSGAEYGTVTYVEGDGSVWITDRDAAGNVESVHTAAGIVPADDKWHDITFLRNTIPVASPLSPVPSGLESIYVDGVLRAEGIMTDTFNNPPAPGAIGMGFPLTTSSGPQPAGDPPVMAPDYSNGLIDNVRVYNRLLTATATAVGQTAGGKVSALYAAAPTMPGDANMDGTVDINDLTVVLANYSQSGMNWTTGDFTGSGTVDINDLTIVLANYNQSASAAGLAAVPEPSSLLLTTAALIGLLACRGRRRKS